MIDDVSDFDRDEDEEHLDQYDDYQITKTICQIYREWATINAFKDTLGIYLKGSKSASYKDIVDFGQKIAPAILGDERLFFNDKKLNELYEEYRERADALSRKEQKDISIIDAVDRGIQEHEELIKAGSNRNLVVLNKKLRALKKFRQEMEESSHTENNLIIRDVYKVKRGLPFEDGKDYRDFRVGEDRAFRIRVFHPDHFEHITGADLVYECYSEEYKKVRVAAVQYKIRRNKSIYIDERIDKQITRLEKAFCNQNTCKLVNNNSAGTYRLPHCSAFLRPTDEIQPNDPHIMSRGYYVPICIVRDAQAKTEETKNVIQSKRLRDHAVSHKVFEELFNVDMLGSRWITYDELKRIYQSTNLLEPHQSISVHVQEYSLKRNNLLKK